MDTDEIDDGMNSDLEPEHAQAHSDGTREGLEVPAQPRLGWLYALGVCGLLAAASLALLPKVAPEFGWIVRSLAKYGASAGALGFAGLGCLVLARSARSIALAFPRPEPALQVVDYEPALESLAAELAQARAEVQDLRIELVYVKDAVARLADSRATNDSEASTTHDSIFRLAASVDQVGGQIARRLDQSEARANERLNAIEQRVEGVALAIGELQQQAAVHGALNSVSQAMEAFAGEIETPTGYDPSADDLHIQVELEEAAPAFGALGVLDELDDFGNSNLRSHQHARPNVRPREDFPGPLPHGQNQREALDAGDFASRLELARALLADPRIAADLGSRLSRS